MSRSRCLYCRSPKQVQRGPEIAGQIVCSERPKQQSYYYLSTEADGGSQGTGVHAWQVARGNTGVTASWSRCPPAAMNCCTAAESGSTAPSAGPKPSMTLRSAFERDPRARPE